MFIIFIMGKASFPRESDLYFKYMDVFYNAHFQTLFAE